VEAVEEAVVLDKVHLDQVVMAAAEVQLLVTVRIREQLVLLKKVLEEDSEPVPVEPPH
jgi:hypothetical protein